MGDLGPHNLQGSEVLVYIRRLTQNAPPPPNWTPFEYHLMAALPTNDNPRYSIGDHNPDMTTKFDYFYRFDDGPPPYLKIQTGKYPDEGITGIIQVKLYFDDTNTPTFYQQFKTYKDERYDYVPYTETQIGIVDGNNNLIDYSGIPEIKFALVKDINKTIKTEAEFNKLDPFPIINQVPAMVDQTGIIKITNPTYGEDTSFFYTATYPKTFQICEFQSVDKDLTPYQIIKSTGYDFAPRVTDSGNVQNPKGAVIDTPPSPVVKAFPVGTQLHKIPLHEITNSINKVECKSTHLAYLIGPVSKSAPRDFIGQSNPDGTYKIYSEVNPATYLFTSSSSFYKRLPECWPWSCRRWTVEKTQDSQGNWNIAYFSQDSLGNKTAVSYNEIPQLTVGLYAINGQSEVKQIPILNGDPTSTEPYSVITPDADSKFIDGYLLSKMQLNMDSMDEIKIQQCGCNENDEKIELALEVFPLLHKSQCKLIMKTGYLCYRTKDCKDPSPGLINKKIITPFNACKFNESLAVDLDKTNYPSNSLGATSITFDQKDSTIISYLKTPNLVSFDPYNHPSGVTLSLNGGSQTINLDSEYKGYLSVSARFPCNYSSDINVYKVINGNIQQYTAFPNNEIYNCPQNYIGYSAIQGNGTDESETANNIVTGGDYYMSGINHVYYNDSDPDTQYEIYKISSIGNAGGFINVQQDCCKYCVNNDGVYKGNDGCYSLDIEGTENYINNFLRVGDCDNTLATRCDSNIIQGRALLRIYVEMPGDYTFDGVLAASGTVFASGDIRPVGQSIMPVSGTVIASGDIWVLGDTTMQSLSSFQGTLT